MDVIFLQNKWCLLMDRGNRPKKLGVAPERSFMLDARRHVNFCKDDSCGRANFPDVIHRASDVFCESQMALANRFRHFRLIIRKHLYLYT